ncbi:MAG: Trimeric GatFAB AmidoTransferase(AdT) complex subunit [Thelocarpon superellum]|nr:MAG: Trimeric GatFAB AmidoTransferase(AdT) complex subunit [Thelocarpon superellum]
MSLLHEAEICLKKQTVHRLLNAFISYAKDSGRLLDAAAQADGRARQGMSRSAIDGHFVAIKDNICTKDYPTTCASNILQNYTSPYDATVIQRLAAAGAVVPGKTNLDEFGMGSHSVHSAFGPVKHRSGGLAAGGSSGGSAVAVATSQCHAALGTDTGGSVRLPAAYTGVVGFKPSYGLVSRWGVVAYANSLDTVGILARTVQSTREVFDIINAPDNRDPTNLSTASRLRINTLTSQRGRPTKVRIGVPTDYNIAELHPEVQQRWVQALQRFQQRGHTLHAVSLPSTRHALSAYYVLAPAEASSNLAKYDGVRYGSRDDNHDDTAAGVLYAGTRGQGFGAEVKRRILLGAYSLSADAMDNYFMQAQRVRRIVREEYDAVFALPNPLQAHPQPQTRARAQEQDEHEHKGGVDVLVCPTAATPPPTLSSVATLSPLDAYTTDVLTVPASLAGLPAISVPVYEQGLSQGESTIGMQIIGQHGDDALVLDVAEMLEGWSRPSL